MRRTRRHKYLQVSVFFLLYSIIHVVSDTNEDNDNKKNTSTKHEVHEFILGSHGKHVSNTAGNNTKNNISLSKNSTADAEGKGTTNKSSSDVHHHILHGLLGHTTDTVANNTKNGSSKIESSKNESSKNESLAKHDIHHHVIDQFIGHNKDVIKHNSSTNTSNHEHILGQSGGIISHILNETCTPPAIQQFPHPMMSPNARRHGGLIVHIIVAVYMFLGLAIVCDEYFVASLDRICEELKMSPDVAGATFMAAGSSAPELATVIIGVFLAQDDIGISGVIGSAVFNIMFVISCCGLCSSAVIYLNWWPLVRDCFFYAVSILVMLVVIYDTRITWIESLVMLFTYIIYCIVLHFNTPLERFAQTLPVPFKHTAPTEESGLVSYKTLDDDGKPPNYGMEWSPEKQQENGDQAGFANQLSGPALNQATTDPSPPPAPPIVTHAPKSNQQDYYKPKEYDPSTQVNPLIRPETGGLYAQVAWVVVYPIHWLCRKTMPDCRSERFKNWYPFTFFVSMLWISFYSYFMVWMITIIGFTLNIPDTVMGLTFVAAGVSVPDALSSIAVIKEGYGDMAVSNAVGSNVFDILICLGLPWFIKTAIVRPGSTVKVISKGLTYSTLSLLSTVVFLVVATHLNGWKLDRRYGIILMIWYLIFITFASLYELNVFGKLNPRQCPSTW